MLLRRQPALGGSGGMAGVVFGDEFFEFVAVFPHEDLGFGVDAADEVGVDDAGLVFGGGGAVGIASVLAGGGDLLFSTP